MKLPRFLSATAVLFLAGCSPQVAADSSGSEFVTTDWAYADGLEFVNDKRDSVSTAPEVLDELNNQALASGSNVEWSPDTYGITGELETYVDDVFLSAGEGNRGCGLWVFGFGGWTTQAVDAGYFSWVEEELTWGEFSDGILGYVLIYTDKETECYAQAMNTVEGRYANISHADTGMTLNPSLIIEFVDSAMDTVAIGNAGESPINFNDEWCIVTANKSYLVTGYGRMVGVMNPQEVMRFDLRGSMPEIDAEDSTRRSVAVGNCATGDYRAIAEMP